MRFLCSIVFIIASTCSFSQGFTSIEGNVRDIETGLPIEIAIISMQHGGFSTAINANGDFIFRFPTLALDSVEVLFSAIGYKSLRLTVDSFEPSSKNKIQLEKADLIETKLGISDARILVQSAVDSLTANNAVDPLLQNGFYHEGVQLEELGYVKIKEATLRVERFPDKKKKLDKIKTLKSRLFDWVGQSSKVASWGFGNGPAIVCRSIETELPVFLDKKSLKSYDFHVDSLFSTYDGIALYVVNFAPKSPKLRGGRNGKIYIEPSSKAIVRLEYGLTQKGLHQVVGKGPGGVRLKGESLEYSSQYRWATDKWVLQENRVTVKLSYEERLDRRFKTNAHWELRFVATESRNLKSSQITELELLESTSNFGQTAVFSSSNWGGQNYILPTKEMTEITTHIRRNNSL